MRELTELIDTALTADEQALTDRLDVEVLLDDARSRASRRRRRRHVAELAGVAAVAVVALFVAVAVRPDPAPAPPAPPVQTVAPTPSSTSSSTPEVLRFTDGEGRPVAVTTVDLSTVEPIDQADDVVGGATPPNGKGQELIYPRFLLDDGTWFASRTPADYYDTESESIGKPSDVGIWDGTAFHAWTSTADLVPGDSARQVWEATASERWVVWTESSSTQVGIVDWRIFAANRSGGDVHLVARAEERHDGGDDEVGVPAVVGDRIYWSGGDIDTDEVVSKDISGKGSIRVEGTGISDPVAVGDAVVVETVTDEGSDTVYSDGFARLTSEGVVPILRTTPAVERPAGEPPTIEHTSGGDGVVAFTVDRDAYVLDLESGGLTRLVTPPGAMQARSTAVGEGFVTWSTVDPDTAASAVYVVGRSGAAPARIDLDREDAAVTAAGSYVGWRLGNGDPTWTVVTLGS